MIALLPLPGHVLVELREKYQHVATTEQRYDTRTSGICVCVAPLQEIHYDFYVTDLPNKLVFWEEYKDGAVIERGNKKYTFIKIEDLCGYEDVESK